jgi:hypothetical protein
MNGTDIKNAVDAHDFAEFIRKKNEGALKILKHLPLNENGKPKLNLYGECNLRNDGVEYNGTRFVQTNRYQIQYKPRQVPPPASD